jgi:hypothetical protein
VSDEFIRGFLQVTRLDPGRIAPAFEEGAEHADVLKIHQMTTHTHAIAQGILARRIYSPADEGTPFFG